MSQKKVYILVVGFVMPNQLFKPAVIIPVYNHQDAVGSVVEQLLAYELPILLVDDGSDVVCEQTLVQLEKAFERVFLLRLPQNGGKGAAVKAGLFWLERQRYSHALQLDADGQHAIGDVEHFLVHSERNPQALINGYPQYDETVPKHRYYARYLTHVWVWINTWSLSIRDSMCGFRVYPLDATVALLKSETCGDRMDFDTEIIVRWVWRGGVVENLPTKVNYPTDGVSHFKLWKDNALISWMHTRLFFGMLVRTPTLLKRKLFA